MQIIPLIPQTINATTLNQVATLIYHTDIGLFRLLFGSPHRAIPLLERLVSGMNNSFSHQYTHVAVTNDNTIAGIIILIPPTPIKEDDFLTMMPWHALLRLALAHIIIGPILHQGTKSTPYIQNISVADSFKGQGVGSQLIDYVINLTQKHGYQEIALDVSLDNPRAQHLYQRLGFVVTNTTRLWPWSLGVHRMHKRFA